MQKKSETLQNLALNKNTMILEYNVKPYIRTCNHYKAVYLYVKDLNVIRRACMESIIILIISALLISAGCALTLFVCFIWYISSFVAINTNEERIWMRRSSKKIATIASTILMVCGISLYLIRLLCA